MEANKIKAVEAVRLIRNEQHELLKGKTFDEVKAYYREKASHARARGQQLLQELKKEG